MKLGLILLLILSACTTITIKPDGEVIVKGPRRATVVTQTVAVTTGQMLINDTTVTALGLSGLQLVPEVP